MKIGNVLSLFDGMSCGQIALQRANIEYSEYYASEIKTHAIKCTNVNYPKTIQLGDVRYVRGKDLPKIDLLIGGSPCQDFSNLNREKNGFFGDKSGLFFEYLRLLKETKPKYFLLENVMMENVYIDKISDMLGVYPVRINSSLVSAQYRDRLYWANWLPGIKNLLGQHVSVIPMPKDKHVTVSDVLENGKLYGRNSDKFICLVARAGTAFGTPDKHVRPNYQEMLKKRGDRSMLNLIDTGNGVVRCLTQKEAEKCQTLPEGYTRMCTWSEALDLIGDGWTVDVISYLFSFMK